MVSGRMTDGVRFVHAEMRNGVEQSAKLLWRARALAPLRSARLKILLLKKGVIYGFIKDSGSTKTWSD